ncbi:translocation/assembly module TamB domain-containing protein [Labrys monachus]|uniref:Translocation and assembly module TamB n=1 Tax=Labrys monachus TaxID=217067 RepID=A0ABU0FI46_9HYPH|nr:translocation/assembly module TamB domain-containing protein [Labrys monachus]MDQ0394250.1 translocation and assembly module TamB [Labrys monachus]
MRRKVRPVFLALLVLLGLAVAAPLGIRSLAPAFADDASDKSWFISYVENTISTPDQKISLGQINGVLSSDVTFSSITIADRQGVWLTIRDAHLVWSRLALLTGKLDIDKLEAASIEITRRPNPPEGVQPANSGFSLPQLPVSVKLGKLAVPVVKLSAALAGDETTLDVSGDALLADGKLHADLNIVRVQPPGGKLSFTTDFDNASRRLSLDLSLQEPHGGFLSNLLNVPGKPSLGFTIVGAGPIDNFAADIALSADGTKLVSGRTTVTQGPNGLAFDANVGGSLERLVDPAYADFVRGQSSLSIVAAQAAGGGYVLDHATVRSGVLDLALSGALSADAFPTALKLDARIGAADRHAILLPGGGGAHIDGAVLTADFGDGGWKASFDLKQLAAGTLRAGSASISAGGEAQDLADAQKRSLTFKLDGHGEGLTSTDPAVARALGTSLDLTAAGRWQAGQPMVIDGVRLAASALQAGFAGRIEGGTLSGTYTLATPDISVFSGLAGRDLRGRTDLEARGDVALVGGALSLALDGSATDVAIGDARVDALLAGKTTLNGGVSRDRDGIHFKGVELRNSQFGTSVDGLYGVKTVDLAAKAHLAQIQLVTDRASGAVDLTASLKGNADKPLIQADLTADRLMLQGKPFRDGKAGFSGTVAGPAVDGTFSLSGLLDKMAVKAGASIATGADGTREITGLTANAGAANLAGDLALRPDGLASGHLTASVPDMAAIAPLLLVRASGSAAADITLSIDGARQNAAVKAQAKALRIETVSIGSADIDLAGTDLRGVPGLSGSANASNVQVASFVLRQLQASARQSAANVTALQVQGVMPRGRLALSGSLSPAGDGFDARLDTLSVQQDGISASLQAPVTVASRKNGITIPRAVLRIGQGGTVSVDGSVGEALAMNVAVNQLPLSLANLASPGLGASGTLTATAKLSGKPADPVAEFQAKGSNLSANALRNLGLSAMQLSANGRYAAKIVTFQSSLSGGGGLSVTAGGQVPLSGPGLSVAVKGSAPLAVANALLSQRGARVTGTLSVSGNAAGSIAAPVLTGQATIANGSFTDPDSGMRLTAIAGAVRFDGQRATITQFRAATQGNGTIGLSGSVSLKPDFDASLAITLRNAKLSDGDLATAVVSGDMTVRGPLMSRPALGGRITVQRAEITIPERFAANAAMLGVKHLRPPPEVARTLARAHIVDKVGKGGKGARKAAAGPDILVDLVIDAPARIFVRGRGIDAELGGRLALKGPVSNLSPVGAFELRRGSLDVVGQHIVFDSGRVTLTGDFDPAIDFVATTKSSSIAVTARVTGQASDPQIVLSSVPELPQDEVMAHFLFGHSIQDLSPLQIVQLATAVAQLAGGSSGPDLLGSIRKSTGLDSLGVVTDSSGNAAVQAGRYITDKVYLGVTTGAGGQTDATINLDVTKHLKLRGQAGTEGSQGGIYYEQEY